MGLQKAIRLVPALVLAACSAQLAQGGEQPALIAEPSPAGHAELERIVSEAMYGAAVTLAPDALTQESELVIERAAPHNLQQPRLNGRELVPPQKFRLVLDAAGCWLVRATDGQRWQLDQACIPAEERAAEQDVQSGK